MKTILFLLVFLSVGFSQQPVKTENAQNKYKNYTALTTGDTIYTFASAASGSSIRHSTMSSGYIVGLFIGSPVASDTIIIKNGVGQVLMLIQPSTGMIPQYYPVGIRVDTSLIYIQKKASVSTLIYRTER